MFALDNKNVRISDISDVVKVSNFPTHVNKNNKPRSCADKSALERGLLYIGSESFSFCTITFKTTKRIAMLSISNEKVTVFSRSFAQYRDLSKYDIAQEVNLPLTNKTLQVNHTPKRSKATRLYITKSSFIVILLELNSVASIHDSAILSSAAVIFCLPPVS